MNVGAEREVGDTATLQPGHRGVYPRRVGTQVEGALDAVGHGEHAGTQRAIELSKAPHDRRPYATALDMALDQIELAEQACQGARPARSPVIPTSAIACLAQMP